VEPVVRYISFLLSQPFALVYAIETPRVCKTIRGRRNDKNRKPRAVKKETGNGQGLRLGMIDLEVEDGDTGRLVAERNVGNLMSDLYRGVEHNRNEMTSV
jgi:hypothetical protein